MASSIPQSGLMIAKRQSGTANQNLRGEALVRHRDCKKSLNLFIEYIHHHAPSPLRVPTMVRMMQALQDFVSASGFHEGPLF
jgi:hypothetical protein